MRLQLIEELGYTVSNAGNEPELFSALSLARDRMGFDHFALSYEQRSGFSSDGALLAHDYPDAWANVYLDFDLGGNDPVRRACERSMIGFAWCDMDQFIPLTRGDARMLSVGREHGIGDGFTVPRHLPGLASGSCSFVMRPSRELPKTMLSVAEIVGALALTSARRIVGLIPPRTQPRLTERQRECVLWSARAKTAAEIAKILGISEETVIQHLKTARERYEVTGRYALILCALFEGLISFADIFRFWYFV